MKIAAQNNMYVKSVEEIMRGSNLLSTNNIYNPTATNDPFYEPYTFYNTLCSIVNTYYVYDHSSRIFAACLGNTRITYTPTVMPDGLHYTLNGVYDYYPYGKILREYVQGPQEKYLTTHHQRDEETGLDYRGARFYDCDIARFLSLDPLAYEVPSRTSYHYCANNPILFVDPTGQKEEVYINGDASEQATEQLQASVKGQLNISRDKSTGKVTATVVEGVTLEEGGPAATLLAATQDQNIDVKLNATKANVIDGKAFVGGMFGGSTSENGCTTAEQTVNPKHQKIIDKFTERGKGVGTLHEVLEAYVGAQRSPGANANDKKAYTFAGAAN